MPPLNQIQKQITDFVMGLTVKQKLLLLGGVVLTVAVLALFAHFISSPDYVPLMTGMEAGDAQALGAKLAAKNIAYQISPDGKSVSVPADKLDSSRMEIASDGMPHSGRLGFELFDKLNWGETEFDEKVNYQRALEGELERSIQTLRDVESVRVHLVLPTDSIFLDRETAAKASVILKLRSGRLPEQTQLGIARLVAGAVDKLSPENVTVIDSDTDLPLGVARANSFSPNGSLEQEFATRILNTIEPIVGAEHARASVNVEYDSTTTEENAEIYDPDSAVAISTQRSEERIGGGMAGGVPGTSSNIPGGKPAAGKDTSPKEAGAKDASAKDTGVQEVRTAFSESDSSQYSKSESNSFAVNKRTRHTLEPAGRIRKVTAALLVDDATETSVANGKRTVTHRKRTPEELKQIQELASAAIGIDPERGDSVTVQNLAFEQAPVEETVKPPMRERVRTILNDWSVAVRYGALLLMFLLAYLLILRPVKRQLLASFQHVRQPVLAGDAEPQAKVADAEAQAQPEVQRSATLKKQLVDHVKKEPNATSKLIQAWIHEEPR